MSVRNPSTNQHSQLNPLSQLSSYRRFNVSVDLLNVTQSQTVRSETSKKRPLSKYSKSQPMDSSKFNDENNEIRRSKLKIREFAKVLKFQKWHQKTLFNYAMLRQKALNELKAKVEHQELENEQMLASILEARKKQKKSKLEHNEKDQSIAKAESAKSKHKLLKKKRNKRDDSRSDLDESIGLKETEPSDQCLNISWMPLSERVQLNDSQLPNVTFDVNSF
ncbi:hypothetical protein M3Y98_00860300 [Aphelenchoides besseyi]|nr:hypothetical protein M3Y98_00860300 [Aphelenchoides besseyi]KAI6211172.1 hypothetical protein M3Y96_00405700 [Aphelenchoides besseyi]